MRAWLGLWSWLVALSAWSAAWFPGGAKALDDTQPELRWGVAAGLSGSLPVGDVRAAAAARDEVTEGLWVDIEPLQVDIGASFNVSPVVRFVWRGGVDPEAIEAALDPTLRRTPMGKQLDEPNVTALELGMKARYFPWGDGRLRPYGVLGFAYTTLGAGYETVSSPSGAPGPGGAASTRLRVHRHQGLSTRVGVGLRYDVKIRAFNTDMRAPVALELSYTHNTWLALTRNENIETQPDKLLGEGPFVDYLGLSLTVGFLR